MELQNHREKIVALIDLKRWQKALEQIQDAMKDYPNVSFLYLFRGICLEETGQEQASIEAYQTAISINPDYENAYVQLAKLYFTQGENELAKKHADICLTLSPNDATALAISSLAYMNDKPLKANRMLKAALVADPTNKTVQYADAYHAIMGLKLGRIKKLLVQNMEEDPTSPGTMFGMGTVELSRGNFERAEFLLRESYVGAPDAGKMDAWIDARLGKYPPFKWLIPFSWMTYGFALGFQSGAFLFWIIFGFILPISSFGDSPYAKHIWAIHGLVAIPLVVNYVIKYPIQYITRRKQHQETLVFTGRDWMKSILFLSTIIYVYAIITQSFDVIVIALFILLYAPLWFLVKERTHPLTKGFFFVVYLSAWISLFATIWVTAFTEMDDKWISLPVIIGWMMILLLADAAEKFERRY